MTRKVFCNDTSRASRNLARRDAFHNKNLSDDNENAVAVRGATAVQLMNEEETSAKSADLRQLVCSLFVDSIVASVPKNRRKDVQKGLTELMQRLNIVSSDYFTDTFSTARRPLSLLISKVVVQACQQGSSIAFAPDVDSPLFASGLSLVNSRYLSDFEEISRLGVGGFGKVFKVRSLVDNQLYAIKQIRFDSSSDSFAKVLSECRYHASLQNEHVVRYHNAWVEFEPNVTISSKSADNQILTSSGNRSHHATSRLGKNPAYNEKRVFECNDSSMLGSVSLSTEKIDAKSGKFWRRSTSSPQISQSTFESNSEDVARSTGDIEIDSSVSVKFALTDSKSSNEDDGVQFADESHSNCLPKNDGAIVLWSETQDRPTSKHRGSVVRKSVSSPSFTTISTKTNVDVPVLYIQMELCSSTLERYLADRKALDVEFNEATVLGLLSAIDFLHKNQLIHRDVKPSNVLLKRRNGRWCALLGDFGLTREVSQFVHGISSKREICRVNMLADTSKLTGGIGTALYAAPEQIYSHDYGPMVDVYSAGIVFYELFHIFNTSMERIMTLTKLRENARPTEKFRLLWLEICTIIERMIPVEPNNRWTAGQILSYLHASKDQQYQHGHAVSADSKSPSNLICAEGGDTPVTKSYESTNAAMLSLTAIPGNSSLAHQNEEVAQLRKRNLELEAQVQQLRQELETYRSARIDTTD